MCGDGWAVQQNIVRTNGRRAVLLTIIKNGDASTLDVVNRVKAALPEIRAAAPPGMNIGMLFDQSVFVQTAITSVLREGAIAAGLTALMILIFLGSWRSTLIVMISIPLPILTSVAVMWALVVEAYSARPQKGTRFAGGGFDSRGPAELPQRCLPEFVQEPFVSHAMLRI